MSKQTGLSFACRHLACTSGCLYDNIRITLIVQIGIKINTRRQTFKPQSILVAHMLMSGSSTSFSQTLNKKYPLSYRSNFIMWNRNQICSSLIPVYWCPLPACSFQQPSADHLCRSSSSIPLWFSLTTSIFLIPLFACPTLPVPGLTSQSQKGPCDGNRPLFSIK